MGGKTGTTTQSMQIPPEVLARYNAVNARAETTAQQPFQQYSTSPESFVAQLNPQQQQGISNVNQYAAAAQPAYQAAMQGTAGAYGGLSPQGFQQGVQGYMSPFLSNAMSATAAQMQNVNRQQQQDIIGNAVKAGAFGGDRGAIARSALANQQNLAMGQTLGNMAQQGYQSAAQNYLAGLGQQGQLSAQMGALGAGAQQAGLQGAQAQIGAGTLGQQTEQAGKTALYNQFLQQQAYPFQVAQFLANIAMGTGALSGSQTTTTQPMSFFSDRRLKEDIKRIGESDEGLPIYKFKYKGDPNEQTHIGFMADEVEKVHPEAVGESHGFKTVDYNRAAKYTGGLVAEGGAVGPQHEGMGFGLGGREHHAYGRAVGQGYSDYNPYDPYSIQNIIARQQAMFATPEAHYVPLARQISGGLGKHSRVPEAALPISQLRTPSQAPALPDSMLKQGLGAASDVTDIVTKGKDLYKFYKDLQNKNPSGEDKSSSNEASGGRIGYSLTGAVTNKEDDKYQTPEGLYSAEQTGKLNIPTEMKNYNLARQSTLPGAMQDPTMRDIMAIVGMFKADGGSIGREHHDGSEGNIVGKKQFGPYKFEPTPEQAAGVDPDLIEALQRGSTAALPKGYYARFVSGHRDVNPQHPNSMHSVSGPAKATDIEIVDPEGKALPNYQDPRFFKPYHDVAKSTLDYLEQKDPEMAKRFSWGGLFSGPPGKYGAMDTMHYSFDEPMAGGTIKGGLNPEQAALFEGYTPAGKKAAPAAEPSMLDKLADMVGFTKANAQELKDKNLQGADSTDLLLSILAGAGTMASSNSPFLGAAILQGIGGGAKTYAGLRGQALERGLAQQGIDITARTQGIQALKYLKDRFEPLMDKTGTKIIGYRDLNGGQVSVEQYNQIMQNAARDLNLSPSIVPQSGGLNVTTEPQEGAAGEPIDLAKKVISEQPPMPSFDSRAQAETTTKPAEENKVDIGVGKPVPISFLSDPATIQTTIEKLNAQLGQARGPQADVLKREIETLNAAQLQIASVANSVQTVYDPETGQKINMTGVDYLKGLAEAAQNKTPGRFTYQGKEVVTGEDPFTKSNVEMFNDQMKESNNFVKSWKSDLRPRLVSIAGIYQKWKGAGRGSEGWAELNDFMRNVLGMEPFDPEAAPSFDAAAKDAMLIALQRTNDFAKSAPATGGEMAMVTVPDPNKNPDALYKNITDAIGYGDLGYKRSSDFIRTSPRNVSQFNLNFSEKPENDAKTFIKNAQKEIEPFAGSNPEVAKKMGLRSKDDVVQQDENTVVVSKKVTSKQKWLEIIRNTPKGTTVVLPDGRRVEGEKE